MQMVEIAHCCGHTFGGFNSDSGFGDVISFCPKCKQTAKIHLSLLKDMLFFPPIHVSPHTEKNLTFEVVDVFGNKEDKQ